MSLLLAVLSYCRSSVGRVLYYLAPSRSMRCPEIFRTRGRGYTAELSCGLGRVYRERRTKVRDQNHGERIQIHVGGKQTGTALVCVCVCGYAPPLLLLLLGGGELACLLARFPLELSCMQTAGPCSRNENGSVEQHQNTHTRAQTQGKAKTNGCVKCKQLLHTRSPGVSQILNWLCTLFLFFLSLPL